MKKYILPAILAFSILLTAGVSTITKKNGLELIYDYSTDRDISAITAIFDGGTQNYTVDKAGIEKMLLMVMEKGSKKYPEKKLNDLLDRYGINIAFTADNDYSYITFSTVNKYFPEMIDIASDIIINPSINKKNVELARSIMMDEINSKKDSPDEMVWDEVNKIFYEGHPYSATPSGKIESVRSITNDDLKKHHEFLIKKNRIALSIVTGVPYDEVKEIIEKDFSKAASVKNSKDFSVPAFNVFNEDIRQDVIKKNLETKYVAVKYVIPSVTDPEYIAMRIGLNILSRRVYEQIRTKHGLSYAPWVAASMRKTNYGIFYVSTDYPDSAISLTMQEFDRAKADGVTVDELNDIKNLYETSFYQDNEKASGKSLSNGINYIVYGNYNYNSEFVKLLEALSPEAVKNVLNKYLKNYITVVLTKE